MINRPLLLVEGPAGSGKTTLIEASLGSADLDVTCIRAIRDSALQEPQETRSPHDPELYRYQSAGATRVALYRYPPPFGTHLVAYLAMEFARGFRGAVWIEGNDPIEWESMRIFVAPPPTREEALLYRVLRDREAERQKELQRVECAIMSPGEMLAIAGGPWGEFAARQELLHRDVASSVRSELRAHLKKIRAAPPLEPTENWAITPRYAGIEHAQVVVVNVRGEGERATGEALLQDLARIRKDPEIYRDIFGVSGHRTPITAVVADLTDRRDPGLKKALRRIRRVAARSRD